MLDEQTLRRMQELFGGQKCTVCGQPARRLSRDKFYCEICFLTKRESDDSDCHTDDPQRKAS